MQPFLLEILPFDLLTCEEEMSPSSWEQAVWYLHLDFEHEQAIWVQVKLLTVILALAQAQVWVGLQAHFLVSPFQFYHCLQLEEKQ